MEKIVDIIEAMAHEKNISLESAVDAFKEALVKTAKRCTTYTSHFEATVDMIKRDYRVEQIVIIAKNNDERFETEADAVISLVEAHELYGSDLELGDELRSPFILEEHGRTASFNLFKEMVQRNNKEISSFLIKGDLPKQQATLQEAKLPHMDRNLREGRDDMLSQSNSKTQDKPKPQPVHVEKQVGRNDPCPCGSGKKFKHCHGRGL